MRAMVFMCRCGKVKKYGEFIQPTRELKEAIRKGNYNTKIETCPDCKAAMMQNRLAPVKEK